MAKAFFPRAMTVAILLLTAASPLDAKGDAEPEVRLAAQFQLPKLPGLGGPSADWRQWDAFFTFIVKRFGQDVGGELRGPLGDAFLDSRYELTRTVTRLGAGSNPVPQLFLNGWRRLSPIMNKALPALPKQTASRYANFISAADKLAAAGQLGSKLGVLQISPDALRGMARLLEPRGTVDPIAYNLNVDSGLRNLLGLGTATAVAPSGQRQSWLPLWSPFFLNPQFVSHGIALAAEIDLKKLNQWVPAESELQPYLLAVRALLTGLSDKVAAGSKLAEQHKALYRQIVFAAAWQESCWRQFIRKGKTVTALTSPSGDLGLMQVNRHTWRSLYDLKRLAGDIEYNSSAGGEILLYYLSRHAIKQSEDKQAGGHLARATYSAYNGGPSQLARYRAAKEDPELKKVDEAFWEKFQVVRSGRELEVQRCYEK